MVVPAVVVLLPNSYRAGRGSIPRLILVKFSSQKLHGLNDQIQNWEGGVSLYQHILSVPSPQLKTEWFQKLFQSESKFKHSLSMGAGYLMTFAKVPW